MRTTIGRRQVVPHPLSPDGRRANASYQQRKDNPGVTEIVEIPGRDHSLTIDSGWREVAETALAFVRRFH